MIQHSVTNFTIPVPKSLMSTTPLYHLHHKSVQISELVRISEVHSLIYKVVINYPNRTHIILIEHTLQVIIL